MRDKRTYKEVVVLIHVQTSIENEECLSKALICEEKDPLDMESIKAILRMEKITDIVTSKVSDHSLILSKSPSEIFEDFVLEELDALKRIFYIVKP